MPVGMADAVRALRAGGLVAYPTEAVFGLGCLPNDEPALQRLCALKDRDPGRGLILIGAEFEQLRPYLKPLDLELEAQVLKSWPGAITWVLPSASDLHPLVTGGRGTVAVRVPGSALARELCSQVGSAITSTSANLQGELPLRDAAAVSTAFGDLIDCVLDGPTENLDQPSEIRDGLTGEILRHGGAR